MLNETTLLASWSTIFIRQFQLVCVKWFGPKELNLQEQQGGCFSAQKAQRMYLHSITRKKHLR